MLCCVSAAGAALPPMIIYPKGFPGGQYRFGGPDDYLYARSDSGWVDSILFLQWFKKIFLKYTVRDKPTLLIVDGHKSHMTLELVDLARENHVILFCLPPHTTHALQPLDVAVFKALKAHFSRSLRALCFTRKDFTVSKRDFARVVKEPFEMAFSIVNIKSGYKKCGIFPFNPDAVDKGKMVPSSMYTPTSVPSTSTSPSSTSSSCIPVPHSTPGSSNNETDSIASSMTPPLFDTPSSSSSTGNTPASTLSTPASSQSTPASSPSTPASSQRTPASSQSTPASSQSAPASTLASAPQYTSPITNPLVSAGLIPPSLSHILTSPTENDLATKPKRRVIKARVLTEDEFVGILKDKERKEQEAEEEKKQRKILREEKKKKREEEKAEKEIKRAEKEKKRAEKKKENEQKKKAGRKRSRKRIVHTDTGDESEEGSVANKGADQPQYQESTDSDCDDAPGPSKRSRTRSYRIPSRYRNHESIEEDSDGNASDTVCAMCECSEPEGCDDQHVFCDACDRWFHTHCVYGKNRTSCRGKLICEDCLP